MALVSNHFSPSFVYSADNYCQLVSFITYSESTLQWLVLLSMLLHSFVGRNHDDGDPSDAVDETDSIQT